ncbi:hypothetical protein H4582DRAFT_1802096 [Lactarius indigo]|nr:hypothetical protein H4582DRAFT_1802096 [Lactarius indigo]
MFYPQSGCPTTFKYSEVRMLRIIGCTMKEEIAVPAEFDNEGKQCLIVGKDENTTDLTVRCYSSLKFFTFNKAGIKSRELTIYNTSNKGVEVFSARGDSGSLVWHMKDGKAHIVCQLHSAKNRGSSTSNHVTYCTPG